MTLLYRRWRLSGSFAKIISTGITSLFMEKPGIKKTSKNYSVQNNSHNDKQPLIFMFNVFSSIFAPATNYNSKNLSVKFERGMESFSTQADPDLLMFYLDKNDSGNLVLMLNGPLNDEKKREFSRSFVRIMEKMITDQDIKIEKCIS